MRHRVRLFVLPHGHGHLDPAAEGSPFDVEADGDDAVREVIKGRLIEWGYTLRSVSALAGARPGDPTYAATVVAPAPKKAGA